MQCPFPYRKLKQGRLGKNYWGASTHVVDADGCLIPVFRGQHGVSDTWGRSLSFGSAQAASQYAMHPNDSRMMPQAPKVFPVYLDIQRPFLSDGIDPFMDISRYAEVFGQEEAMRVALKFKAHIESTDFWSETHAEHGCSLEELASCRPEVVCTLYFQAYPFLDDQDEVARLCAAGFDGAIYGGSGANAMEVEYRAFTPDQVRSYWDPQWSQMMQ